MILLVTYVLIALGFSFLCSLLEATLLTITASSIESAKQRGVRWAKPMERLKADIDRPLSAILTLNTVAHTMGAAGAGAQYARLYGDATGGVFAGLLTLAILIFTEIIPKTLGARHALFFATPTAWLLPWLEKLLTPLVWLCRQITRLITLGRADSRPMHRQELIAVAHLGERVGEIGARESMMVRNVLQLGEIRVSDIMTPRPVIFMLPQDLSFAEAAERISDRPFSRIPVYHQGRDDVVGFVLKAEVLLRSIRTPDGVVEEAVLPLAAIPEQVGVDRLFEQMLREGRHLMIVRDEFGTIVGLVSLEDVLETVIGTEILDETDRVADMQGLARRLWQKRARRMGIPADDDAETKPSAPPASG